MGEERQRDHNVADYYSDDVNVVVTYHTAAGAAPHADQEAEKLDSSVVCHNQAEISKSGTTTVVIWRISVFLFLAHHHHRRPPRPRLAANDIQWLLLWACAPFR